MVDSSKSKYHEKNNDVLNTLSEYYMIDSEEMWEKINKWEYNYDTSTYLLLLSRLKQGLPLKLSSQSRLRYRIQGVSTSNNSTPVCQSPVRHSYRLLKEVMNNAEQGSQVMLTEKENITSRTPNRTNRKRGHGTGVEDIISPIPTKRTPRKAKCVNNMTESPFTPVNSTPGNKLLCSLEKKLNKVGGVLTPRKRNTVPEYFYPNILTSKQMCNVSTTPFKDPDVALEELKNCLRAAGICCESKGFIIRGKIAEPSDKDLKNSKLSFELEICFVQSSANKEEQLIGIKRKRLKGDAWAYKKV